MLCEDQVINRYGAKFFIGQEETQANRGDGRRVRMFLSPAESLGICESIAGSMYLISFGSPYAAK